MDSTVSIWTQKPSNIGQYLDKRLHRNLLRYVGSVKSGLPARWWLYSAGQVPGSFYKQQHWGQKGAADASSKKSLNGPFHSTIAGIQTLKCQ